MPLPLIFLLLLSDRSLPFLEIFSLGCTCLHLSASVHTCSYDAFIASSLSVTSIAVSGLVILPQASVTSDSFIALSDPAVHNSHSDPAPLFRFNYSVYRDQHYAGLGLTETTSYVNNIYLVYQFQFLDKVCG